VIRKDEKDRVFITVGQNAKAIMTLNVDAIHSTCGEFSTNAIA
jgi:hypothetical protein